MLTALVFQAEKRLNPGTKVVQQLREAVSRDDIPHIRRLLREHHGMQNPAISGNMDMLLRVAKHMDNEGAFKFLQEPRSPYLQISVKFWR